MSDTKPDRLIEMNDEYSKITGENFFLYLARPGDGQTRYVFTDEVKPNRRAALAHMESALNQARENSNPNHSSPEL